MSKALEQSVSGSSGEAGTNAFDGSIKLQAIFKFINGSFQNNNRHYTLVVECPP